MRKAGPAEPSGRKLSTSAKITIRPCCRWMCAASGTSATGGSVPAPASRWPKRPEAAAAAADSTPPAPLPSGFAKSACTFAWLPDGSADHRVHGLRNSPQRSHPSDRFRRRIKKINHPARNRLVQKLGGTKLVQTVTLHARLDSKSDQKKTKQKSNEIKQKNTKNSNPQ